MVTAGSEATTLVCPPGYHRSELPAAKIARLNSPHPADNSQCALFSRDSVSRGLQELALDNTAPARGAPQDVGRPR